MPASQREAPPTRPPFADGGTLDELLEGVGGEKDPIETVSRLDAKGLSTRDVEAALEAVTVASRV